jgi:DNA-binding FadR family transcriptional regulator
MSAMKAVLATVSRLKDMIAAGEVAEDGRLPPERELAERVGVSRRTLRCALKMLEDDGQIWRRQGAGTFVGAHQRPEVSPDELFRRAIDHTNPVEVLEVRLAVEPTLARLAALRASRADIEKLYELAEETRTAASEKDYERADAAFHRRVALAARNALFTAVLDAVVAAIEDASWHGVRENAHCSKQKEVNATFHRQIAEAIALRNCDQAESLMYAHLSKVQTSLLDATAPRARSLASVGAASLPN